MEHDLYTLSFGDLLRSWRDERRFSQADLAAKISTPSRHISFLETGRARPSRTMVTRLVTALQVPLRERNLLYKAAGFADIYPSRNFADGEMEMLRRVMTRMMHAHDPYPAFVFNRQWDIFDANATARRIIFSAEDEMATSSDPGVNALDLAFDPSRLRPLIENWEDYARQVIQRLHRESISTGDLNAALDRIAQYPDLPADWWTFDVGYTVQPFFPIRLRLDGGTMSFFATVATIAAPTDTLSQELRVETLFPFDEFTEQAIKEMCLWGLRS